MAAGASHIGEDRRRPLALLFTDISGSTTLAASMEPEVYADLLTTLWAALQRRMEQHNGQILRVDGDGALCAFGHIGATEHAGRDAAQAALAFHDDVASIAERRALPPLALHSGIHAGVVLLRQGDVVRGRFEVLGDATNVAARLCDAARAGEILISEEALGGDAHAFDLTARRTVVLPDSERTLSAYRVSARRSVQRASNTHPIIGRDAELRLAREWLAESAEAAPVFYVQAEAGGGKTHLLAAIADVAAEQGLRLALGQCEEDYLAAPLQPVRQIMRSLTPAGGEPATEPDALKTHIVAVARQAPLLLMFDDWQWADDATKRLVEQSMAQARGALRLLVASRSQDGGLQGRLPQWTIGLQPLDKAATATLVATMAPHFEPQRARKIFGLSGGNPLLIEELCRDPDVALSKSSQEQVSFRVAAVVERRLSELPSDVAALLDRIAVFGGAMPLTLLSRLASTEGDSEVAMVAKLSAVDFLRLSTQAEDGRPPSVRFRHALLRQAVYNRLSPDRRRALHRETADALLAQPTVSVGRNGKEQLAFHLLSCGDVRGVEYALDAGKAAMQAGSLDRALGQYRRAIEFLHSHRAARDEVTALRLANRFGSAVLLDPHLEHFAPLDQLQAIAEQQGLRTVQGRLLYWRASLHYATGRPDAALQVLKKQDFASVFAESGLPNQLVTALKGQLYVLMACHGRATAHLDQAIDALQALGNPGYDDSLAYMVLMRAQARGEQGFFAGAERDFARAERLLLGKDVPLYASILTQKAGVALWREDYVAVRALAAEGLRHGDRIGSRYYAVLSRALDAAARGAMQPDEAALAELEHCLRWCAHAQSGYTLSLMHSWAADLALRVGNKGAAADHAHRCLAQGRHRLYWGASAAWRVRAALADTLEEAENALTRAYVHARRMLSVREWAATMMAHGAMIQRYGDQDGGAHLMQQAKQLRAQMGLPHSAEYTNGQGYVSHPPRAMAG